MATFDATDSLLSVKQVVTGYLVGSRNKPGFRIWYVGLGELYKCKDPNSIPSTNINKPEELHT